MSLPVDEMTVAFYAHLDAMEGGYTVNWVNQETSNTPPMLVVEKGTLTPGRPRMNGYTGASLEFGVKVITERGTGDAQSSAMIQAVVDRFALSAPVGRFRVTNHPLVKGDMYSGSDYIVPVIVSLGLN